MRTLLLSGIVAGLAGSFIAPATWAEDAPASQPVAKEPVAFAKLKAVLPEKFLDLARKHAAGSKTGMAGMKMSQAEGNYGGEEADAGKSGNISIIDYGGVPGMWEGLAAFTKMELDNDSDTESSKTTKFAGYPAMENFTKASKHSQITIAVANRFLVSVTSEGIPLETVRAAVEKLDFKAMEAAAK